ncbi:MAG: hypothetical protein JNK79_03465 [Chitinophagaceae bacterium]|nr:hypothetical protein [Chitinophagaceae bacterium]
MKKIALFSACLAFLCTSLSAQTSTQRIYIKGGSSAWENFMKEIYMYPAFETGIVEYKNGQKFKSNMNYNKALGTVQFIDEKGDTLSMNNEESIGSITIGDDVYRFDPECVQAVKSSENATLYKRETVRIADKLKTGGYGIPNTAGTIESIDRLDTRVNYNQIELNESLLISKVTTFYIENRKGEKLPASKKNILNLYSKHDDAIRSYIKSKNLDLSKEEGLIELTDFISKL